MQVEIPKLNSLSLFEQVNPIPCEIDGYCYIRKFLHTDKPIIQILSSISAGEHVFIERAHLLDEYGVFARNIIFSTTYIQNFSYFNLYLDLKDLSGKYRVRINLESNNITKALKPITSEWFMVKKKNDFKNVLIQVRNSKNKFGVIFNDKKLHFTFRVDGGFYPNSMQVNSDDTIYKDQRVDFVQLSSFPYESYRINLGGRRGISNSFIALLNRAFSCDTVLINGVQFSKKEGSSFEAIESENYPYRSWVIEVAKSENQNSKISEFGEIFDETFDETYN